MSEKCIKVYVKEDDYNIISQKAKNNNLSLSNYLKICAFNKNKSISTIVVREFSMLSNNIYDLQLKYDIEDKDLNEIYERIKLICLNL